MSTEKSNKTGIEINTLPPSYPGYDGPSGPPPSYLSDPPPEYSPATKIAPLSQRPANLLCKHCSGEVNCSLISDKNYSFGQSI